MAATLVVGTPATTTIATQSALAYLQKKDDNKMVETKMVTQLPFRNANRPQHRVDLITTKNKNVKT